jgi:uncharacterized protein (DUF983 family)
MENDSKTDKFGPPPQHGSIWPRLWRGMKLRCPRCGDGKLFRSFLKPVERCSVCEQAWDHVRADLAPAWAAMTISAHFTVAIWHFVFWGTDLQPWQLMIYLCGIATAIALLALPPMKGLFMAIIWAKGTTDS